MRQVARIGFDALPELGQRPLAVALPPERNRVINDRLLALWCGRLGRSNLLDSQA